tara:strand:- start:3488 stop:4696 length:1209 start_codon:yes stop_codon:yes gene_type:complete
VRDLQLKIANKISASASQTALSLQELIGTMKASGMTNQAIKEVLLNDLNRGGQLFGTFRNNIKNTVRNGVEFSSNQSSDSEFVKAGVKEFRWVSVGDKSVCIDCQERHGEIGTMSFYEKIGLPASGFSICQTNCRCKLLPVDYKDENLDKPLLKKENYDVTLRDMAGKHTRTKDSDKWLKSNLKLNYTSLKDIDLKFRNKINRTIKKHLDNNAKLNLRNVSVQQTPIKTYAFTNRAGGLIVNSRLVSKDFNISNDLKKGVKSGWNFRGGDKFEAVISHELGHNLSFKHIDIKNKKIIVKTAKGQKLKDLYFEYIEDMKLRKNNWNKTWKESGKTQAEKINYINSFKKKGTNAKLYEEIFGNDFVSQYASQNVMEWIAESYAMAYHTANPSKYALTVKRLIDG